MQEVKTISPQEAWEIMQKEPRTVMIDVRSDMEFLFGKPDSGVPILLICRSGKRSLEAGNLLVKEGFCDVYNVAEGFEGELDEKHHRSTQGGWRFHGLPWEQC